MRIPLAALALLFVGCDASVRIDPDGYRCDVGNLCPSGYACRDGVCRASTAVDPSCANVTCNTPPPPSCVNGATVRTFAGRCLAGQCQYDPVDSTCATTCSQGACVDACAGVSCVTPPRPACTDAATLRTFAQTGACAMGTCSYVNTDTTCVNGCEAGRCKGVDLCQSMSVVCNMPPAATCVGSQRRTFSAAGQCDPGTGVCTYVSNDANCPNGCALGQCLTASLAFAQTGPRLHFAINGIDIAPGSSGNSALAVGNGGKLARWDGSMWTALTTPGAPDLNRVAFVSGTVAYAVGASRTALTVRPSAATNQVTPVSLSGSGNANLIGVSGRGEGEVLIADDSGAWWRLRSSTWTNGTLPGGNGPYDITAAYLDESLRERIVGACGSGANTQCVGYRFASGGTPNFVVHPQTGTPGFTSVGGGFDVASATSSEAFLGNGDNSLDSHSNIGLFTNISPTPSLTGDGVVGITAQSVAVGRDVFVLTSSRDPDINTSGKGSLFRLEKGLTSTTSTEVLETYFGEETLSPNEANGVLVAEVRRAQGINNVFRRGDHHRRGARRGRRLRRRLGRRPGRAGAGQQVWRRGGAPPHRQHLRLPPAAGHLVHPRAGGAQRHRRAAGGRRGEQPQRGDRPGHTHRLHYRHLAPQHGLQRRVPRLGHRGLGGGQRRRHLQGDLHRGDAGHLAHHEGSPHRRLRSRRGRGGRR